MVATPTFTAPISDPLTKDHIRSSRDSRITSSLGPLWMMVRPSGTQDNHIAEAIADPMGTLVRIKAAPAMRPATGTGVAEQIQDIGGNSEHIWMVTRQYRRGDVPFPRFDTRLYELSPDDFSVRRQQRFTHIQVGGCDGDSEVIYIGNADLDSRTLLKLDAITWDIVGSVTTGIWRALTIAGDKHGCWICDWTLGPDAGIREYTAGLTFVRTVGYPFDDAGHKVPGIGGGSQRMYCKTFVENDLPDWRAGAYLHTVRPADFAVIRTYGPGRSVLLGGM